MFKPMARKIYIELTPPSEGDAVADKDRIIRALEKDFGSVVMSYDVLKAHYMLLRNFDWKLTVTMIMKGHEWEIIQIERGNTTDKNYGYAVDLGSTTIIMQLVDLATGVILGQESMFNAQIRFGDEILSRIFYAKDKAEHLQEIQVCTLMSLNELIASLQKLTGISSSDCGIMVIGGNTTMIHFLLGLDPWFIFHAPYSPAFNSCGFIRASSLNLQFPGLVYCYPSAANYIGGDIISGLIASELYLNSPISLYMDIGTNGEMILGNNEFLLAAAGAAGPALEGGISKYGMQAKPGAVDSVKIVDNQIVLTTIQNQKPLGICGSGIVDLLAEMLLEGWIDRSGAFVPERSERIVQREEEYAVVYAWSSESASGEELLFTQNDIFSYMDTKAAANTMVAYLLEASGVSPQDIKKVYLAGAFGTHLNLESAITIGLYPDLPRDRFVILGNGSLAGACKLLLDASLYYTSESIIEKMVYLSLGEATDFLTKMFAAKFLPHTDLDLYPTVKEKLKSRNK
ncbi:Uncharacterized 2Fe-2 and 4Fe-4S clusters-containing protein, contains DUF4445 domain [Sporobacter termitidis DSM 10068]|uniref:Uncharacterized 2Fe-2 and 4Fe-4S clusters-containing protein, contains DUF4445 domain n=1 Tax=Sporobacter termitidis DSM 10068 TaxID=1123282 RepID=A0A1M5YSH6_9FIRM|nr:ASKHA domain-containing protein [Sporobacter termitidis]SHI14768.1 Uncharacterized 2Fe-2 and 4Fe-4S clusters-containing protein, contains DUF4445 domain [Sporobacter termitidis DSM 10068]